MIKIQKLESWIRLLKKLKSTAEPSDREQILELCDYLELEVCRFYIEGGDKNAVNDR